MGVPAFFRWLSRKYPSIVVHCVEDKQKRVGNVKIPIDLTKPNPNGVEFDNLYLDMNGIIHPCCHPEDKPAPKNEDEMMQLIFEYIDRLMSIVRPRKLLYMAIDGVAPRAKMNQQRSRRFRAAKESVDKSNEIEVRREDLLSKGARLPSKQTGERFDNNCITPGTPFMDRLAQSLHYYVHERMNSDPGWRYVKVFLSDANKPGEGEHKIMDFIRRQRVNPEHDPNTSHCLCGADADLIMLGLATHEVNFTIIREEFNQNKPRSCDLCGQTGHEMKDCTGLPKDDESRHPSIKTGQEQEFIFLRLNVLREYLEKELAMHQLPFPFDFERVVDDWVFMCFFVGNDFLPHLPSLEIREGAIDRLVELYQKNVGKAGGYLTDSGDVHLERVQLVLTDLGEAEDGIFKSRQQQEVAFKRRLKEKKRRARTQRRAEPMQTGQFAPTPIGEKPKPIVDPRSEIFRTRMQDVEADKEEEEPVDEIRLWENGWKDRYYGSKFGVTPEDAQFRREVALEYCRGLSWVLKYYYQGCPSWTWYFPHHYAPFASDFVDIGDLNVDFEKNTRPFAPMEQLMAVFPAASRGHVPESWGRLMTDPESPILDFYPDDFEVDLNGKRFAWQGVALLPFVDENRLLEALQQLYPLLTEEEMKRNRRGDDKLYVSRHNPGFGFFNVLYEGKRDSNVEFDMEPKLFGGVAGTVLVTEDVVLPNGTLISKIPDLPDVHGNQVLCARYRDPGFGDDFVFKSNRLPNAVDPPRVLRQVNLDANQWRPQAGMAPAQQRAGLDQSGHRTLNHYAPKRGGGYGGRRGNGENRYNPYDARNRNVTSRGQYEERERKYYGYVKYDYRDRPNREPVVTYHGNGVNYSQGSQRGRGYNQRGRGGRPYRPQ